MDPNNMLFRLEDLTYDRVLSEYGITEELRNENPGLYKQFVEDFIPTREDVERQIDEASLKELCTRLPCRVLMHRWNPVHDFIDQFTRQGRIQRWTPEKTEKLLAKAVNRYKNECLYSDDEIRKQREREWCERKKENLMRLQVWEYDRNQQEQNHGQQQQGNLSHLEDVEDDNTIQSEEMEMLTVEEEPIQIEESEITSTPSDLPIPPLSQSNHFNSADFRLNPPNSLPTTQNTEELAGREYIEMVQKLNTNSGPYLIDYINVNTESMPFDESTTVSEDLIAEECTPPYYEFNTHISMTSTQSPTAKYI
ncbi:telomere-binding protein cav isoform X1 [Rhagoletis pomonella]|uniref:telomere-binding protein cav isoform X1 n=2 Tax=Rhagoletis pomonella TaxID=28610 RepID=UPI00177BBAB1|nr:telomere-binding protein cav isoform X1 [Rhagoletis pomonella]